jgi:hypothetical protein
LNKWSLALIDGATKALQHFLGKIIGLLFRFAAFGDCLDALFT